MLVIYLKEEEEEEPTYYNIEKYTHCGTNCCYSCGKISEKGYIPCHFQCKSSVIDEKTGYDIEVDNIFCLDCAKNFERCGICEKEFVCQNCSNDKMTYKCGKCNSPICCDFAECVCKFRFKIKTKIKIETKI